jgi:RimJ/RimL family protein N-acetyltransferase
MSYEVRPATVAELKFFYEAVVLPAYEEVRGLFLDGKLVAVCGVLPDPSYTGTFLDDEAPTIGFFDALPGLEKTIGFDIVRRIRGWLKEQGRTILVQCDDAHPTAEKFLRTLGFKPSGERRRHLQNSDRMLEIWRWEC